MNKEDLFKKIGVILKELNTQYEYLSQNPQKLNELELALFHANADFLSDHAQILIKVSKRDTPLEISATVEDELQPEMLQVEDRTEQFETEYYGDPLREDQQMETVTFAEEIPDVEKEVFKLDQAPSFEFILNETAETERQDHFIAEEDSLSDEEKFEFEEKSVDELFNRPLSQEEENILAQKRKLTELPIDAPLDAEEDEIGPEPFLVSKAEDDFPIDETDLDLKEAVEPVINTQKTAVEDPSYKPTLNDVLAGKADRSLNDHSGANALTDLKQGINLNDKLIYIKDLFNGYNLAYAEAIDLANKLPNFDAADNFFKKNYAIKNNWAEKQATVDKFYALLNQRFKS